MWCAIVAAVLVRDGEAHCTAEAATAQVPTTLHGLLLARLDRLDAAERRVIQEAAVIGPTSSPAAGRSRPSPRGGRALDALAGADLVTPGPDHRFRHGLLQEIVYQNILVARRTGCTPRGHGLEARARRAGEPRAAGGARSSLGLGADKRRGARYLMAAGDWARGMYANADAIQHYQRALDALERCDGVETGAAHGRERMAGLLGPTGRRAAALGEYEIVGAGYRAAGTRQRGRGPSQDGGLHWDAGARARALRCFEAGLALLDAHPEHIERAHLYQEMGRLAFRSGDSQRAVEWAEQARSTPSGSPPTPCSTRTGARKR